ncbi:hypothetical protein HW452_16600 [Halomonas aquamarina]|uniref:Uncharacterized protein n=1 Tax=Vreelandella aquamarina TaxID=77097 RepID=A0ACC5VZA5_9GAMM|nr:hypothetical protein [Halomonas aquamarina]MBZ5489141.1 hypothetical protein [Halomonas aquamarina]
MIKKIALGLVAGSLLSGCASQQTAMDFSRFGDVQLGQWGGGVNAQAVKSVAFAHPSAGDVDQDKLAACVAENVTNRGVTLSDTAGSHFGTYTGNYYQQSNQHSVGGGSVIVREGSGNIVAEGITEYSASALVKRAVRFTMTAQLGESGNVYRFSNLEQAQLNSGAVANSGFDKIGAWQGANPDLALVSLEQLSSNIDNCIKR